MLLKTAKSFLLPWCVKNRKTGSGAAPGKAAPDAKQRFDDYTKRCGGTIGEMAASIRRDQDGFQQVSPELTPHRLFGRAARPARGTAGMDGAAAVHHRHRALCRCRAGPALHGPGPARGSHRHGPALLLSAGCRRPAHDRRGAICGPRLFREPAGRSPRPATLDVDGASLSARSAADYDGRADIAFISPRAADLGNTANAQVAAALPDAAQRRGHRSGRARLPRRAGGQHRQTGRAGRRRRCALRQLGRLHDGALQER